MFNHDLKEDLTGKRFGRLVAISYTPGSRIPKKAGIWKCRCDCGNVVDVEGGNLRSGNSSSCGCLRSEMTTQRSTKHKGSNSGLYKVWAAIKQRCTNPNQKRYKDYGGRGIRLYPGWIDNFGAFQDYILSNLGPKPSPKFTLDRINNDGNYEPGNLRWATYSQQVLNSRHCLK